MQPRQGYNPQAEALRKLGAEGGQYVLDADIRDYFGSIAHDKLMKLVERRVSDGRMLKLLRQWLQAGVLEEGAVRRTVAGTPQGGVISPLLANIYLHLLDEVWTRRCAHLGTLVRYCDDFVVMCRRAQDCEEAQRRIEHILRRLELQLHPDKTRRVALVDGKEGFDFLGCHLRKRMSGRLWDTRRVRRYYLHRWPNRRAMSRIRERVRDLTSRRRCHQDLRGVVAELNPVLRGWGQYFRTGNASRQFTAMDSFVVRRLRRLRMQRKGRHLRAGEARQWNREYFEAFGLHRLRGTIRYPAQPFFHKGAA